MLTRCCFLGCKGCCCLENPKCKASVQREAARWGSMRQSSARRSDLSTLRGSRPSSRDHIKTIQTTTQPFSCVTNLPSPLYIREHILYIHSIYSRWTAYTLHIVRPQQRVKRNTREDPRWKTVPTTRRRGKEMRLLRLPCAWLRQLWLPLRIRWCVSDALCSRSREHCCCCSP